jgi:hypothetical protein
MNYLQVSFYDSSLHIMPSELLQQIKSVAYSRAQVWKGTAPHLHDSIKAVRSAGNDVGDSVKKPFTLDCVSS